jgi:lactoylglutathione lyase
LTYRVLAARRVRDQLREAPPELRGYVDGIVAFLRVDPTAASVAFVLVGGSDYKTIIFAEGRGFLGYHVLEEQRVVVLVDLAWIGAAAGGGGCGWMAAVNQLGYVILFVGDLERSVGFYRDVVGLELKLRGDGYVEFVTAGAKFGLYDRDRLEELTGQAGDPPGAAGGEVVFLVGDVDAETERLRGAGARILAGPVDRPWGHRTLHLEDPDGFVVELAQEIPRQPAQGRR